MVSISNSLPASCMGVRYCFTEKKAHFYIIKVKEAMSLVLEEKWEERIGKRYDSKKKKNIDAIELTGDGKEKVSYK